MGTIRQALENAKKDFLPEDGALVRFKGEHYVLSTFMDNGWNDDGTPYDFWARALWNLDAWHNEGPPDYFVAPVTPEDAIYYDVYVVPRNLISWNGKYMSGWKP